MNLIFSDYFVVFIFIFFAIFLSIILYVLSYFLASKSADLEKLSAYECGFDPFEDARSRFDIRFYLVGILFIIFDLEVAFLFPWSIILGKLDIFGFWMMIIFLIILTVGFIYEWKKGALEWE